MNEDSDTESDRGETPRHPIFSAKEILRRKTAVKMQPRDEHGQFLPSQKKKQKKPATRRRASSRSRSPTPRTPPAAAVAAVESERASNGSHSSSDRLRELSDRVLCDAEKAVEQCEECQAKLRAVSAVFAAGVAELQSALRNLPVRNAVPAPPPPVPVVGQISNFDGIPSYACGPGTTFWAIQQQMVRAGLSIRKDPPAATAVRPQPSPPPPPPPPLNLDLAPLSYSYSDKHLDETFSGATS